MPPKQETVLPQKPKVAAIYVRKSTTHGLDMDYNSLEAQTDACRAYIRSQAFHGWVEHPIVFSDGGYSGGTIERPALTDMLARIKAGEINVVVVYKLDRLVRSIVGFVHLQEVFEEHEVSFVSITQQFDTSTPIGRVTQAMLVSFGQFEREMASDRVKDKILAAQTKGIFCGGIIPYGYISDHGKLKPDPLTAQNVATVFRLFNESKSLVEVARKMNCMGIPHKEGREWQPQTVSILLRNPRYVGDIRAGSEVVRGQHEALVSREEFDAAQAVFAKRRENHSARKHSPTHALLEKRIFCGDCDSPMIFKWTSRKQTISDKIYGYYCCHNTITGSTSCRLKSVPSCVVEKQVERAVEKALGASPSLLAIVAARAELPHKMLIASLRSEGAVWRDLDGESRRKLVRSLVLRVAVYPDALEIQLDTAELGSGVHALATFGVVQESGSLMMRLPVTVKVISGNKQIVRAAQQEDVSAVSTEKIGMAQNNPLLRTLARGYAWLGMLDRGEVSCIADLSERTGVDKHFIRHTLKLAMISPRIQRAIINGQEPDGLTLAKIRDLETDDWAEQERILGFAG